MTTLSGEHMHRIMKFMHVNLQRVMLTSALRALV